MRERIDIQKMANIAIIVNAVQIAAVLVLAVLIVTNDIALFSLGWVRTIVVVAAVLVCWGAAVDIREAQTTLSVHRQAVALEEAYAQLETLNRTLRAQRHDFMNHLQVVYSLIEMDEPKEACEYIERVHGDLQRVGSVMRTDSPAINALLSAKLSDCERRGIRATLTISSPWQGLPVPGWEMCRVLGNLIDNAMDALAGRENPQLTISLFEDVKSYRFQVENNGPEIPEEVRRRIFSAGFTTKQQGQGMGLHIVEQILTQHGGQIEVASDDARTLFSGFLPKSGTVG